MAQFVRTIIELTDDLDGSVGAETIEFGWDGKDYVIDLSTENAAEFRETIEPWLEAARSKPKAKAKGKGKAKAVAPQAQPTHYAQYKDGKVLRDAMRKWGRHNGFEVSNFSKIPSAVVQAYEAAHPHSANGRKVKT